MAGRSEVLEFLNQFKSCVMLGFWHVKAREKNRQGLIDLDLTPEDRKELVLGLTPEDYHAGPKPDDTDDTREVWEFGKDVAGVEVYIKLRVVRDPRRRGAYRAMVWSFHPAEHRMRYPLRKDKR